MRSQKINTPCSLETPTLRLLKSCFHLWRPWIISLLSRLYCSPQGEFLNHLIFMTLLNSKVWLVQQGCQREALFSLICQSPVKDSAQSMDKNRWRKCRALAFLTLVTHEWTVILVCLHTLQISMHSTISFPLNTWQFSSLTCDEDKAQHTGYLQQSCRWIGRGDTLVWNWFLLWGFLWRFSAHHFSFQNTRTNQSSVCFSFLLNSTWKSTLTAGYWVKQKMETVCCRLFTDCCWANLITDLCNSIIISLDENITDLNFVKEVENRHNTHVTVTDYSAVDGKWHCTRTNTFHQLLHCSFDS